MRFACLGSGSKGNAWLVESGETRVMIDCGFGVRDTVSRLQRLGVEPEQLNGIALTHEHSDHVRGAAQFSRRYGTKICLTHGCDVMTSARDKIPNVRVIDSHECFSVNELEFRAFPVPHDAREPVQFVLSDGCRRFALLTDAGHVTDHMVTMLEGCDALAIECNHDVDLLRQSGYPQSLKTRILGHYGHLDNYSAADLLSRVTHSGLQHVVAAHLSEENNTPQLARSALAGALGCAEGWIGVADQQAGLDWRELT